MSTPASAVEEEEPGVVTRYAMRARLNWPPESALSAVET
jgi:hypothetical protein